MLKSTRFINKIKIIKIASFFLTIIASLNLFFIIQNNLNKFTEKFNPKKYEKKYNNSQYVISQSKNPISDADLYTYAGYQYIKGKNPLYLNAEHLTLGKYFIGLSILVFNNQNIITLIFTFLIFIVFFKIIYLITNSFFISSAGLLLLSFDSFIYDMIANSPLLDIYQLFFLLLIFYFLIKIKLKKSIINYIFIGIFLGLFSSVKFYLVGFLVFLIIIIINFLLNQKLNFLKNIFIIVLFAFLTFNLTYIQSFILKTSFLEYYKSQKWIFNFWRFNSLNNIDAKGNFLKLIIFNQWKIWWNKNNYINYQYWNITWPIFFLIGIIISLNNIKKLLINLILNKKQKLDNNIFALNLFSFWIIIYCLYLFLIPSYPRYLILLYPIIYLNILIFFDTILKLK